MCSILMLGRYVCAPAWSTTPCSRTSNCRQDGKTYSQFAKEKVCLALPRSQTGPWDGAEIMQIHRGISFDVEACMKPYIELTTGLRAKAQNEFEKDFVNSWTIPSSAKRWWTSQPRRCSSQIEREFSCETRFETGLWTNYNFRWELSCRSYEENGTCFQQAGLSWNGDPQHLQDLDVWLSLQLYKEKIRVEGKSVV